MKKYIFIVGCPRSGTKFIRGVLNGHPDIAICPETHFFSSIIHKGAIKKARPLYPIDTEAKLNELRKLLTTGQIFGSFWRDPEIINYDELIANFAASDRTYRALFELLMQQFVKERGKVIGGEKTPSHLFHVDTLIEWFPDCRVIHILRDPRAVLASEANLRRAKPDYPLDKANPMYNFGLFLWVLGGWRLAVNRHARYEKRYPNNYFLVRFEDLYLDHKETVKQVSTCLGIEFDQAMLNPPIVGSSFQGEENHNPVHRWKERLPLQYATLLKLFLNRHLGRFGY